MEGCSGAAGQQGPELCYQPHSRVLPAACCQHRAASRPCQCSRSAAGPLTVAVHHGARQEEGQHAGQQPQAQLEHPVAVLHELVPLVTLVPDTHHGQGHARKVQLQAAAGVTGWEGAQGGCGSGCGREGVAVGVAGRENVLQEVSAAGGDRLRACRRAPGAEDACVAVHCCQVLRGSEHLMLGTSVW
jgi:hypothetical protein